MINPVYGSELQAFWICLLSTEPFTHTETRSEQNPSKEVDVDVYLNLYLGGDRNPRDHLVESFSLEVFDEDIREESP